MKKLLITGSSGLLGGNLVAILSDQFQVMGTYRRNQVHFDDAVTCPMNIVSFPDVQRIICEFGPHVIIHCAAETRVDYCEENPDEAYRINVEGALNVARVGEQVGAKIVYISTDSVFDGNQGGYSEDDEAQPINVYAKTKMDGEAVVARISGNYLIIRTNIYGWNVLPKLSLAEWVLNGFASGNKVPGFTDIFFTPLLVNDLAFLIGDVIKTGMKGLFHLGSHDKCSKFEFASMIGSVFGRNSDQVFPCSSESQNFRARRPKDTSLNVTQVSQALGRQMPSIWEGLLKFRALQESGYVDHLKSRINQKEVLS